MKQLESGCYVRIGETSKQELFSVDKNAWYSTEQAAIEVYAKKQALIKSKAVKNG